MPNPKTPDPKTPDRDSRKPQKPPPGPLPVQVPPLFRRIDWLSLLITFAVIFVTYFLTLAPELTLEDSGELVTGSMYAGIPHPPGYPVWTIYSWLWTVLLPVGSMAYRVAVGEALSGALACGLIALMVSRGSSMFMEGIEELKNMTGKWESAICMISGFVAGVLVGLDGFMWKESVVVNRIAVFSVPWMLLVLVCLLRWLYAPHQFRFAYLATFVFGICMTTHQSLIVASIAIEIALAAGNQKLGRDAFLGNFLVYLAYQAAFFFTGHHLIANLAKPGLYFLFNVVGLGSLAVSLWLASRTQGLLSEWKHVLTMLVCWILGASFYLYMPLAGMSNPPMQWGYPRTVDGFFHALSRGQYEQPNPTNLVSDFPRFVSQLRMLIEGVADEFTWVYIFIALVPFVFFFKMQKRERAWLISLAAMWFFLGVFLITLLNPSRDRASADLIKVFLTSSHTVVACLIGYGLALTAAYMGTHYARFRPWGLAGGALAVVLALYCLFDATGKLYFGREGRWLAPADLLHWIGRAFAKDQYGLPIYGSLILLGLTLAFVVALVLYRHRGPLFITLGLFSAMPLWSALSHWFGSEQRGHMFGYWFGHDMFTPPFNGADGKPIYPPMTKDAILYGGTDPGRFCPTYMIFCESFTPHHCQTVLDQKFDRRDVYIITQNALADGTYLNYIRAHYNRSAQIDPPFFQDLLRSQSEREKNYETNILARMVRPLDRVFTALGASIEKRRRTYTSWFKEEDFVDLPALAARLRPGSDQDALSKYLTENLSPECRQLLSRSGDQKLLRRSLARDLNHLLGRELDIRKRISELQDEKSDVDQRIADGNNSERVLNRQKRLGEEIANLSKIGSLYDPTRFKQVQISDYLADFIKENPQSSTRIRLNRLLLEAAYPKLLAKSLGGVYPDREMYIATPEDSAVCFQQYMADAQRRMQHDLQFPNEPKQLKLGEDVRYDTNTGKVSVAGQVAVMAINGLLTKVMFDHNPKNEFFVEESFPLDWMYPHLTPFGVIMKINRQPLPDLNEDTMKRDHDFWKQFSKRLTGDFIDYDTPVKQVCDWVEKIYLRRDFSGFTGDRKFVRDDDAQKAFSKLRSSIAGVYAWRLSQAPLEYRPKSNTDTMRVFKEADFAFRQAFAFCPYSPEAVFRYCYLLAQFNRLDDAILIAKTCLKMDPENGGVVGLIAQLEGYKSAAQPAALEHARLQLLQLEQEVRRNPTNFPAAIELARIYLSLQQSAPATQLLDTVLNSPAVDANTVLQVAQAWYTLQNWPKLEAALDKYVALSPGNPEGWYDLAKMKANLGKNSEALAALRKALDLSGQRLQSNPKARDLLAEARKEPGFTPLRSLPEFQKLVPAK